MERFSRMLQAAQSMGMSNAPQGVSDSMSDSVCGCDTFCSLYFYTSNPEA